VRPHSRSFGFESKVNLSFQWRGYFETIEEAQDQATEWLWTYNNERPNMGIGGITPAMKLKTAA